MRGLLLWTSLCACLLQTGCATMLLWDGYEPNQVEVPGEAYTKVALHPGLGPSALVLWVEYRDGAQRIVSALPGGDAQQILEQAPEGTAPPKALVPGQGLELAGTALHLRADGRHLELRATEQSWTLPESRHEDPTALLGARLGQLDEAECLYLRLAYGPEGAQCLAVPLRYGQGCFLIAADHPGYFTDSAGPWELGRSVRLDNGIELGLHEQGFDVVLKVRGATLVLEVPSREVERAAIGGIAWRVLPSMLTVPFDIATFPFQLIAAAIFWSSFDLFD